jgi:hypothetical protein
VKAATVGRLQAEGTACTSTLRQKGATGGQSLLRLKTEWLTCSCAWHLNKCLSVLMGMRSIKVSSVLSSCFLPSLCSSCPSTLLAYSKCSTNICCFNELLIC